jgi:CMP-N-acetylneuraminic acid synthetase
MEEEYNCVAIIPIQANSQKNPGKNFIEVAGKPLFEHMIIKALKSNFDCVFVDTDSEVVKIRARQLGAKLIDNSQNLPKESFAIRQINGNDLLIYAKSIINSKIYVQLFVTTPFLKVESINKAIDILKNRPSIDSVFTVNKIKSWFWFNDKPINYNPNILPKSSLANPIIKETTGLYGIKKDSLEQNKCRIGKNPYMLEVEEIEGKDIDTIIDLKELSILMKRMEDGNLIDE